MSTFLLLKSFGKTRERQGTRQRRKNYPKKLNRGGFRRFLAPVVLVSVSWAGCPPPLSCASSPLGSVLCSCSGSSCSYLWPDWLTALLCRRHTRGQLERERRTGFSLFCLHDANKMLLLVSIRANQMGCRHMTRSAKTHGNLYNYCGMFWHDVDHTAWKLHQSHTETAKLLFY